MSSPQNLANIKELEKKSEDRHEAARRYLRSMPKGFVDRVVARSAKFSTSGRPVDRTMVYKVLHGDAVSEPVEQAILAEEKASEKSRRYAA